MLFFHTFRLFWIFLFFFFSFGSHLHLFYFVLSEFPSLFGVVVVIVVILGCARMWSMMAGWCWMTNNDYAWCRWIEIVKSFMSKSSIEWIFRVYFLFPLLSFYFFIFICMYVSRIYGMITFMFWVLPYLHFY